MHPRLRWCITGRLTGRITGRLTGRIMGQLSQIKYLSLQMRNSALIVPTSDGRGKVQGELLSGNQKPEWIVRLLAEVNTGASGSLGLLRQLFEVADLTPS